MTRKRKRTLALGSPSAAFYRSLHQILFAFGDITFRHERSFALPESIVEHVVRQGFDQVLMPNPYGNTQRLACYRALRARGLRVIASDRGALPDTWFFDHGFNQDSPSYAPPQWNWPLSHAQRSYVRNYMSKVRSSSAALEQQGPREARERLRRGLGLEGRKLLFVPLQRSQDTVIRYFSGAVTGVEEFLDLVSDVEHILHEQTGDEWRVLLKKHPLEAEYPIPQSPRLKYIADDVHIHDLLELADATLVINSGVGLLSLLFGTPTLHVGQAFYGHPGLAESVTSASAAVDRLLAAKPPDPERVERFVYHLLTKVYSSAKLTTEVVTQKDGSLARITRRMEFRELRILGEEVRLPDAHVLVVTPVVPWLIERGSETRVDMMIRGLMKGNKLVSLCVLNMSYDRPSEDIIRELRACYPAANRIEVHKHPWFHETGRDHALHVALRAVDLVTGGTHRIANFRTCPPNIRRAVAGLCRELRPDYLLINYAKMTPAIPDDYGGIRVLDAHDFQTKFLREDQRLNRMRRHIHAGWFSKSEISALRRYDRIIAINPLEVPEFQRLCRGARVHCVPAFTGSRPSRSHSIDYRHDALFVGSISNFNVKGLLWFLDRALPLIQQRFPEFRLAVAGNIQRSREISKERYQAAEFLGVVPDLGALYEQSRLVIAPLLGGAGMKIKVIEALGARRAIVCTSHAAEGIALRHLESAWLADDPGAFAEGVACLLEDDALRERLAQAGFEVHGRDHSLAAVQRALHSVFASPPRGSRQEVP